jgi:hypothetical protein
MTMGLQELENLVRAGQLKKEPHAAAEIAGLLKSGNLRLHDAVREGLSDESRFDLAYNAAHAFSLAALRWHGFRSDNRYLVFQCLPHTLGLPAAVWRVLATCHQRRNVAEYEGFFEVEARLIEDLFEAAGAVKRALDQLLEPL